MKFLMTTAAAVFTLFIIAVVLGADSGMLPPFVKDLYHYPGGDKVGHFILMGLLNFFISLAAMVHTKSDIGRTAAIYGIAVSAAVTAEEISQMFIKGRNFSLLDLGSSLLGIAVFGYMALVIARHYQQKKARIALQE